MASAPGNDVTHPITVVLDGSTSQRIKIVVLCHWCHSKTSTQAPYKGTDSNSYIDLPINDDFEL